MSSAASTGTQRFGDVMCQSNDISKDDADNRQRSEEKLYLLFRRRPDATPIPYLLLADMCRMCRTVVSEMDTAAKKCDKTPPSRARSAYLLFAQEHRPAVQAAQPHLTHGGVNIQTVNMWRESNTEERNKYDQLAREGKQRYKRQLELYDTREQDMKAASAASVALNKLQLSVNAS